MWFGSSSFEANQYNTPSSFRSKMGWFTSKIVCFVVMYLILFLNTGGFAIKESVTANVGEDVILSCTVNFHLLSDAHIAWKLEDRVINLNERRYSMNVQDKSTHLTVSSVSIEDRGNYTCEVRQSSVSSCEFYLSVLAPPTAVMVTDSSNNILHDQEELKQDIDELFSLNCCTGDSGSYPQTQIEWLFHETLTSVEIIQTLKFDEQNSLITHSCSNITLRATEEHTSWIVCAAFHEGLRRPLYTSITFDTKVFTVSLSKGEQRNTLLNGSDVYFNSNKAFSLVCKLEECSKNTTLSWYIDNQRISTKDSRYGPIWLENEDRLKSTATFESPTTALKGKLIKCRAVCGFQAREVSVRLHTLSLPILKMPDRPLIEFQPTSISCTLNDSSKDYVFRWTIADKDVTVNATQKLMKEGGLWMSILSFWPLREHNEQPISCGLGNEPLRFESAQINVLYGAVISNIEVWPATLPDENSDVNITCDVQSNPIHENVVQWERFVNGHSKRWIRIRQSNVLVMKNTTWYQWVLQLVNVKRDHVGLYRCTATNGVGRFAESNPVHLQLNEMGICLENDIEFVENELTTIRCLIKRGTPLSVIRWLINDEEVTRNSTSEDIVDDRGRTVTESRLQFYPLRKYNGRLLTCTSGTEKYSRDTIVLSISYCPNEVTFTHCQPGHDADENVLICESGMSNPPTGLSLEFGGTELTKDFQVTKLNKSKYTGYISSVNAMNYLNDIRGVTPNITCCSTMDRCTKLCDVCISKGKNHEASLSFILGALSTAAFLLAALVVLCRMYYRHRQNVLDDAVGLPKCGSSSNRGTGVDITIVQTQNNASEYVNSSSSSSEAIYEHMKDRATYVNESDGVSIGQKTSIMWDCLLGYRVVDTNSTNVVLNDDTYNPPMFEEVLDDKNSLMYQCDVTTFTGLYQKHVSTTYITEVRQPVRCELKIKEQKTKCGSHSFHTALISRGSIQMKVIVKLFPEAAPKCRTHLHIDELHALETLETHESVARILGLCNTSAPYCIIFEFLDETLHGHLKAIYQSNERLHLNGSDEKTQASLTKFAYDVANGLEYLTRNDFTYPRLTCQNIFLDDYKHCKLHDFTLRELHVDDLPGIHVQDDMQTAQECINNREYTAKTDVWNYGQLLLRIYTFDGVLPMPQTESVEESDTSLHLANLQICPNKMRNLILSCCNSSPDNRPSFKNIVEDLEILA